MIQGDRLGKGWLNRFCLALCVALVVACTSAATQQRLQILRALQPHGVPAQRVPQMIMTHQDRVTELPPLDAVLTSTPVVPVSLAANCRAVANFSPPPSLGLSLHFRPTPRGPPVRSVLS